MYSGSFTSTSVLLALYMALVLPCPGTSMSTPTSSPHTRAEQYGCVGAARRRMEWNEDRRPLVIRCWNEVLRVTGSSIWIEAEIYWENSLSVMTYYSLSLLQTRLDCCSTSLEIMKAPTTYFVSATDCNVMRYLTYLNRQHQKLLEGDATFRRPIPLNSASGDF